VPANVLVAPERSDTGWLFTDSRHAASLTPAFWVFVLGLGLLLPVLLS
jgi:hypothetical protein